MMRLRTSLASLLAPTETKPRPAQEIALDARRAERRAEDERRAAERLYPERKHVWAT